MESSDLSRFIDPLGSHIDDAKREIAAGFKATHWMWFVFPQLRGLGRSQMALRYGVVDLDEAQRFLRHELLGPAYEGLAALVHEVVVDRGLRISDVFGSPDDAKLVSSMTLFHAAAEAEGRVDLALRCRAVLSEAERQGLPKCEATLIALRTAG